MRGFPILAAAMAVFSLPVCAQTFNPYGPGDTSNDSPYRGSTKQQDQRALQELERHDTEEAERAARIARELREQERQRREAERQARGEEEQERASSGGSDSVTIAPGGGGVIMAPSRRTGGTPNSGSGLSASTTRQAGASTPGGAARTGGVAGGNCTNMTKLVTLTTARPTGPGHCSNEITGHLTNRSSERVWCVFAFYNHGVKTKDGGGGVIAPGQTTGGEMAGIWSCGADAIKYVCFPAAPDPYGCNVNW